MSDFGKITHPVAQKNHRCEFCWGMIQAGEQHARYAGVFEGEWGFWRAHEECLEDYMENCPGEEFTPGQWPMPAAVKARIEAARERGEK